MMLERNSKIASLVSQRIKEWEIGKSIYANKDRRTESEDGASGLVITISREHGCNGTAVAQMLSDSLDLELYDSEVVEMIAKDKKIAARVVATLDEKGRSELAALVDEAIGYPGISSLSYYRSLKRVLFTIAAHGNAIIVGRGGGLMIPPEMRVAIRLVAPLETRVRNVMAEEGCDEKSALTLITKIEQERRQFIWKYLRKNDNDPTLYDAVLNIAAMKSEALVDVVKAIHAHHAGSPDKSLATA